MKPISTFFCNNVFYTNGRQQFTQSYGEQCYPYSCSPFDFSVGARLDATSHILSLIPNSFPSLLCEVMRLQGITIRELCDRIPISEHTISILRTKPRSHYSIDQITAIIIGLQLPPFLSRKLLENGGFKVDGNPYTTKYMLIIDTMFMLPYEHVINTLHGTISNHPLL